MGQFRQKPGYLLELQRTHRRNPTPAEDALWQALRAGRLGGIRFLRQKAFDRYIVDFYCASAKLVIEVDGSVHDTPEAIQSDTIRTRHLESRGLTVIRFRNEHVLHDLPAVLQNIRQHILT